MSIDPWLPALLLAVPAGAAIVASQRSLVRLKKRFAPVVSADAEAKRIKLAANQAAHAVKQEAEKVKAEALAELNRVRKETESLQQTWIAELATLTAKKQALIAEYRQGRDVFDKLRNEVQLLEENLEDISFGVYRPHFSLDSSAEYKAALEALWEQDKTMVRNGEAAVCRQTWEVSGSRREGEKMTKQYIKLLVRAFNADAEAAIARVSWNNLPTMQERIRKSFGALNKLGSVMQMEIQEPYLALKLRELHLTHEYEEKKQEEKEEARRIREQMREEERVQRELASAQEAAEKAERNAEKALEKARREAEKTSDATGAMADRIRELEAALAAAHDEKERVKARAELTKCGHVYILSNMGSFGEEIVKIGMTRRLEPRERVTELGDASVPFPFDLHTLIYTENAPALESELHNHFWEHRINLANDRKEFFRIGLKDVEAYLCERGLQCQFTHHAEAKEYRQTCSERDRLKANSIKPTEPAYPVELFADSTQSDN